MTTKFICSRCKRELSHRELEIEEFCTQRGIPIVCPPCAEAYIPGTYLVVGWS